MSKHDTVTGVAPNAYASYLVNGDVDCEDAGFCWRHDATRFGALASECQTYTALILDTNKEEI